MQTDKIAKLNPCIVPLSKIDLDPGPCCMSFGFDLKHLIQSIQQVGLINPPLLMGKKEGGFMIISGYKRILAHQEMGLHEIDSRIMPEGLTRLECLCINLYENLTVRELNPVERGMVLSRLQSWVPQDQILFQYMPLLGLPSHKQTLALYQKIEQDLDDAVKESLAGGRLSMQAVKMLMDQDPASRSALFGLISGINLNMNQQTQVIDDIIDISYIERKSIPQVLTNHALENIVSDPHMNNPQKAKAVLDHLRGRRSPTVQKAERVFKSKVASLDLPKNVQISAPPYFEGPHLKLTIWFNNGKQLQDKIRQISKIDNLDALDFPWKVEP